MPIGILSVPKFAARYSGTDTHNPLCWFKTILPIPPLDPNGKQVPAKIPTSQYTVEVIKNSNVLCYGNSNQFRPPNIPKADPANLALFTMVGAIDLIGSNFGPFGGANTKEAIPMWRHENATPELCVKSIDEKKKYFRMFHQDQVHAVDTMEPALFAPANKPIKRNLTGRIENIQPGSIQVKFPPTFVLAKEPVFTGSPMKRGAIPVDDSDSDEPEQPAPQPIYYDMLTPGPVGHLYPPEQMTEYRPGMLDTRNVKLMQYPIYDEEDELIHPAMYDEKFKQGKIVEIVVSMEGMHLSKDIWGTIRVHSLRMLDVNTSDWSQAPVEDDGDDASGDAGEDGGSDGGDGEGDNQGRDAQSSAKVDVVVPDGGDADKTTQDVDVGAGSDIVQSASSFELEAAGLTDITLEGDVMMADATASTASTSTLKRKNTRAQTAANKRLKVDKK